MTRAPTEQAKEIRSDHRAGPRLGCRAAGRVPEAEAVRDEVKPGVLARLRTVIRRSWSHITDTVHALDACATCTIGVEARGHGFSN